MAVARIRTSDPEVIGFLSRHLADSGYRLEFVSPGEPVQGEADLEIDATRMDLASALAAAQRETGIVTVLTGVLKAAPQRDLFDEAMYRPSPGEYAEVSPYAQGAHLEDEPSTLHKAADSVAKAFATGLNSVDTAAKSAKSRFAAWKSQIDEERAARRKRLEQERALQMERRREQERVRAEEAARLRVEEEATRAEQDRLATIRREELARREADERARRQQEQLAAAETASREAEEQRRLKAEADQRQAEELLLQQARFEEQRLRAEEQARIERERQEQQQLSEKARQSEVPAVQQQEQEQMQPKEEEAERGRVAAASQLHSVTESGSMTIEDDTTGWHRANAPISPVSNPVALDRPVPAAQSRPKLPRLRRISSRDRAFKRAGVAAAFVAVGIISVWSLAAARRPASPLSQEQLVRSATVQQQTPFGPATAVAPVIRPVAKTVTPQKKSVSKSPARTRATGTHSTKTNSAKKTSADDGDGEVVVKHFTSQKQQQAKVKTKNGVKIISESD